jgi:predicted DNA-binding transcriptional regulator AlpA
MPEITEPTLVHSEHRLLSVKQVQNMTSLSRTTLWRLHKAGELKAVKITKGRVAFLAQSVEAFISARVEAA